MEKNIESFKYIQYLTKKNEDLTNRYIEAEKFIADIVKNNWYNFFFLKQKALNFLKSREKYKF